MLFSGIYAACFFREPSAEDAMEDMRSGQYNWFVPIDCKSFDGTYLAKQEYSETEKPVRSIRVNIYDTESNVLVDSIYAESLWFGFQGIMWGRDNYNLAIGLMDGTVLYYEYADGGWHEVKNMEGEKQ